MTAVLRNYWPYDEVTISKDAVIANSYTVKTPWLSVSVTLSEQDRLRAEPFFEKLNTQTLDSEDFPDIQWFFAGLQKYAFAYILPALTEARDSHELQSPALNDESPNSLLKSFQLNQDLSLMEPWTWDHEAALDFSQTEMGIDPRTLFSIVRRFHLLNDLESNETQYLLNMMNEMKADKSAFKKLSALVLRQNHYVTEQCDSVLRASLPVAKSADEKIIEFVEAESGHDKILAKALASLDVKDPIEVQVLPSTKVLMEVFRKAAGRNLLAFAMITDIFERSSYGEVDPFAKALNEGGESTAGRHIDKHREINDHGEHENVALSFLDEMAPVSREYAAEAMRLAELATLVAHQISKETMRVFRPN